MTAAIAKTNHRTEWRIIHKVACIIKGIDANKEIDKFMRLAKMISDFTDQHLKPPKRRDIINFML